jgi:hypothetical protein
VVYDAIGREVRRFSFGDTENGTVTMDSLSAGLYTVRINSGNDVVVRRFTVIRP